MRFENKYRVILHKRYFDKGYSFFGMIKYAFAGILVFDYFLGLVMSSIYAVVCYIIGRLWYKYHWEEAEAEVGNRFNLFVKEMRETYKKR